MAVPLSEHLLGAIRTAQEERQQVAASAEARLPHLPDLDPLLLLPLLPAQQRIRSSLAAQSLHHYIAHTPMNASYKMVIIGLLLLAPPGAVPIQLFARRFFQFYCLLRAQGRERLLRMAVDRLQQCYALHLGYQADFGYVLREAAKVF